MNPVSNSTHDTVIIGSGFGGALMAHALVGAGERVLMIERGDWVTRGPHNWAEDAPGQLTEHYTDETTYTVSGHHAGKVGGYYSVGGPSVFYGGVSLRFRERDFDADPDIVGDSRARWPFNYAELEPYYDRAERIIGVAGHPGEDPTEPPRSSPYPEPPGPLAPVSERIAAAARSLGLHPFRLPLAINWRARQGGSCVACATCDGFACAIEAKNDLATVVIPNLIRAGMELRTRTVAVRLLVDGATVVGVECLDRRTGSRSIVRGGRYILAAGTLASPHLLLASGVERLNPGGDVVGRYLTRHYNEIVFGLFRKRPAADGRFHKQLGIHDFYFGDTARHAPHGKLGGLQQLPTPPVGLVRHELPRALRGFGASVVGFVTGLLVMAEDQPQYDNRLALTGGETDAAGLPPAVIRHSYSLRDRAAGEALARRARQILRRAGALAFYRHRIHTFSHAVGSVRMGDDPRTSVLDSFGRFRGVDNLFVVDGSCMPTGAGVNPSLTIAAIALRAGDHIVRTGISAARVATAAGSLAT